MIGVDFSIKITILYNMDVQSTICQISHIQALVKI